jgi:hypothetical protein
LVFGNFLPFLSAPYSQFNRLFHRHCSDFDSRHENVWYAPPRLWCILPGGSHVINYWAIQIISRDQPLPHRCQSHHTVPGFFLPPPFDHVLIVICVYIDIKLLAHQSSLPISWRLFLENLSSEDKK